MDTTGLFLPLDDRITLAVTELRMTLAVIGFLSPAAIRQAADEWALETVADLEAVRGALDEWVRRTGVPVR